MKKLSTLVTAAALALGAHQAQAQQPLPPQVRVTQLRNGVDTVASKTLFSVDGKQSGNFTYEPGDIFHVESNQEVYRTDLKGHPRSNEVLGNPINGKYVITSQELDAIPYENLVDKNGIHGRFCLSGLDADEAVCTDFNIDFNKPITTGRAISVSKVNRAPHITLEELNITKPGTYHPVIGVVDDQDIASVKRVLKRGDDTVSAKETQLPRTQRRVDLIDTITVDKPGTYRMIVTARDNKNEQSVDTAKFVVAQPKQVTGDTKAYIRLDVGPEWYSNTQVTGTQGNTNTFESRSKPGYVTKGKVSFENPRAALTLEAFARGHEYSKEGEFRSSRVTFNQQNIAATYERVASNGIGIRARGEYNRLENCTEITRTPEQLPPGLRVQTVQRSDMKLQGALLKKLSDVTAYAGYEAEHQAEQAPGHAWKHSAIVGVHSPTSNTALQYDVSARLMGGNGTALKTDANVAYYPKNGKVGVYGNLTAELSGNNVNSSPRFAGLGVSLRR